MSYLNHLIVPSAAQTVDGQTGTFASMRTGGNEAASPSAAFYLNVTAVSGTSPTLDVVIESLVDGVWMSEGAFTQATGVTTGKIELTNLPCDIRVRHTIGGTATPTFTFTVTLVRF